MSIRVNAVTVAGISAMLAHPRPHANDDPVGDRSTTAVDLRFRNLVASRPPAREPRILSRPWLLTIVATTVVLGGCAAGRPSRAELLREGRHVFVTAGCGACHAVASVHSHGGVGPNFDISEQLNRDQIRIQLDYAGGGMPSFRGRLTNRQREAVIEFVYQTLNHRR